MLLSTRVLKREEELIDSSVCLDASWAMAEGVDYKVYLPHAIYPEQEADEETVEALRKVFAALPAAQREVLWLHCDGKSYSQIAEITQANIGTVKSRLHYGKTNAQVDLKVPIKEEVFAEKIHGYTTPRDNENTRVKDLLDLVLLIESGMDITNARSAVLGVFKIRGTHALPAVLSHPPNSWEQVFSALSAEAHLRVTLQQAFQTVAQFYLYRNLGIS